MNATANTSKSLRNVRKGDTIKLPNDSTIHHVLKVGKAYDTGWKKITYVTDMDFADDSDFHKTFSGDGDLIVELI